MEALNHHLALLGASSKALRGEHISGDTYAFVEFLDGVLVVTIDGLGHGSEAAKASKRAAETVLACTEDNIVSIVKQCDEQLRETRGVVMSIASFNAIDNTMTWLGVGNVEAYLLRVDRSKHEKPYLIMRGGVVGYSLPALRADTIAVSSGDTLVMATDGIRSGFSDILDPKIPPQEMADTIMAGYAKENDDAMVVAVRWVGRHK